ncbi:hypothetical protein DFQ26_002132 [Actinomortierella ambigua]|nr:hypothetical protein DFQ26_002132 [Actinomortierella ambigua]
MSALVLGAVLGKGAYGTVYKGRLGMLVVAAKRFHVSASEAAQLAIKKEIQMLENLRCRHVIQFYGTHYHQGDLVVVTDLAEGGSLKAAIDKGIQDWCTKERMAREVSLGLAYIHSQGVLHLDLKSENVLLTRLLEVKLCDFGCATIKTTSATKSAETWRGTVRWMAPELFVRKPKWSTKSDVYSLGMVMWEMAADCSTPFKEHRDNSVVISLVKDGEREDLPEDTPPDYRAWVERCWDHDPSKRPEASELVLEEIDINTSNVESHSALSTLSLDFDSLSISQSRLGGTQVATDAYTAFNYPTLRSAPVVNGRPEVDLFSPENVRRSTQQENKLAPRHLGLMHVSGRGLNQSDPGTEMLLWGAANNGDAMAQRILGCMYRDGRGLEQSDIEAVKWLTKAANQDESEAQFNLAWMYKDGRGTEQSDDEAIRWFTKAAEQGHPDAEENLEDLCRSIRAIRQSNDMMVHAQHIFY